MIRLTSMNEADFQTYLNSAIVEYVQEHIEPALEQQKTRYRSQRNNIKSYY